MTLRIAIDDDERDVYAYTLPSTERHFRGAWEWPTDGTSVIQVNIADARTIQKDNVRRERAEQFPDEDVNYTKKHAEYISAVADGAAITAVTMLTNGQGYTSAPTVSFSGGGGTGATATANIGVGGTVDSITIGDDDGGEGYTSAPVVEITGGSGSGAIAVATISNEPAETLLQELKDIEATRQAMRDAPEDDAFDTEDLDTLKDVTLESILA